MDYSLKKIVESRSSEKRKIDKQDLWVFFIVRPFSFIITWVLMKLQITANQATLISTIISIIGSILMVSTNDTKTFIGLLFYNLWIVFDCVDGNIARTTKKSSLYGELLDGISGYIFTSLLYTFLGVNVFLNYTGTYTWIYLVLGGGTAICTLLPRLIEHKSVNMFEGYKRESTNRKEYSLFYIIGLNIAGMAGLSNPLMLIFFFLNKLNVYIIVYFIIHFGIAVLTIYKNINSVKKLEN